MVLFMTDAQGASLPSSLYQVTDLGAGPASPFTLLATSGTATAFRGVALVPAAVPEPASVGLLGLGIASLVVRRREVTGSAAHR